VLSEKAGTVYLAPIADTNGRPLQAGKTYKLRVPKDTPAKEFWSLTVYDRATWAFINNPLDRAGLDSFNKNMKMNVDGSVDPISGRTRLPVWNPTGFRPWARSPTSRSGYTVRRKLSGTRHSRCRM
jgi:hypothetical protein